jgi:hypothetical protein
MPPQVRQIAARSLEECGDVEGPARASLERLLTDPESLDRRCRAALLDPPPGSEEGATELYVSHHEELTPPELVGRGIEAFVGAMTLRSIWVVADDDEEFLRVDYTLDASRTDYVLCVVLDSSGVVRSVRMES